MIIFILNIISLLLIIACTTRRGILMCISLFAALHLHFRVLHFCTHVHRSRVVALTTQIRTFPCCLSEWNLGLWHIIDFQKSFLANYKLVSTIQSWKATFLSPDFVISYMSLLTVKQNKYNFISLSGILIIKV